MFCHFSSFCLETPLLELLQKEVSFCNFLWSFANYHKNDFFPLNFKFQRKTFSSKSIWKIYGVSTKIIKNYIQKFLVFLLKQSCQHPELTFPGCANTTSNIEELKEFHQVKSTKPDSQNILEWFSRFSQSISCETTGCMSSVHICIYRIILEMCFPYLKFWFLYGNPDGSKNSKSASVNVFLDNQTDFRSKLMIEFLPSTS